MWSNIAWCHDNSLGLVWLSLQTSWSIISLEMPTDVCKQKWWSHLCPVSIWLSYSHNALGLGGLPSWTGRYLGNTTGSEQNRQSLGWRALLFRSTEQERMVSIMLSGLAVQLCQLWWEPMNYVCLTDSKITPVCQKQGSLLLNFMNPTQPTPAWTG